MYIDSFRLLCVTRIEGGREREESNLAVGGT